MGKKKVNFQEDEDLSLEVKKYPILYDKKQPLYKDKRAAFNAWTKIEAELGLEEGNKFI